VENKSGLHPAGRAVLVKPYQPDRQDSIIALPDSVRLNQQVLEQRAIVIEIGPSAWMEESVPRAVVGQKVLVSAYAGYMAEGIKDKEQYRFVNDRDIFATIEE
jgi:co-chaperonin GroES (HSP10)